MIERRYVFGHPPDWMSPEEAASIRTGLPRTLAWPNGDVWAVCRWLDGRTTYEVVGNWIADEDWR
jgi:hypothetical protein